MVCKLMGVGLAYYFQIYMKLKIKYGSRLIGYNEIIKL